MGPLIKAALVLALVTIATGTGPPGLSAPVDGSEAPEIPSSPTTTFDHSHPLLNRVLKDFVARGRVNYVSLKAHPENLDRYLEKLGAVSEADYGAWSRHEKLAYWINAYNAFTLKVIIENYPINRQGLLGFQHPDNSIKQIPGVWDRIQFRTVTGWKTLDQIEHQILRKEFREPRIHFAIVCASRGCPVLRAEAYVAARLDAQLSAQALAFFRDPQKARLDREAKILYLNPILDWFGEDFGDRAAFAAPYMKPDDAKFVSQNPVTIRYLTYDWTLNGKL